MTSNNLTAPTRQTFSRSPICSDVSNQTQPSKSPNSLYSSVSTRIHDISGPNISTFSIQNLHKKPQPRNASLTDIIWFPNRTRYASDSSTNSALLSSPSIDRELQDLNNNKDTLLQRLSDGPFEERDHGNKFFSLSRNVYTDKKVSLQILIFLILLAVTATVGTCLLLLLIETSGTKSNASALNNDTIKKGGYSKSENHKGVNPNPMNLPLIMATSQSPTTKIAKKAKLQKSTVTIELSTTRKKQEVVETSTKHSLVFEIQKNLSYIKISSVHDFTGMQANPYINAITVDKLIDNISDKESALNSYSLENTDNVKHLNVAGSITEDWLISLLKKFNRVENLTISIDGLCVESTVKDPDSLESITLENVQHLMIESSHLCKIITWVFKWKLPKIQQLRIHNSDLTRSTFEPIHTFLEENKKTLTSVIVSNSFVCSTCIFTKEENKNVGNIIFLNEIKNPYLYG